MYKELEIRIDPENINDTEYLRSAAAAGAGIAPEALSGFQILRKAVDARSRSPFYNLKVRVYQDESVPQPASYSFAGVESGREVLIAGCGPAGLFAALRLIESGIKPVILERGRDVDSRRQDIAGLEAGGSPDPDSNYCYGEGGAGAFSDGKLYTRSTKRGDVSRILQILIAHGAPEDILIDSHPHIGSDALPDVIKALRSTIIKAGGAVHFSSELTGINSSEGRLSSVIVNDGKELPADTLLLACGHSARDTYSMLERSGVRLESKLFAVGVRVEHPQSLIDRLQYHSPERHPGLPPASYFLKAQAEGRGVYTFCMCPGGRVIPASTSPGEVVLNGMSPSSRSLPYANSAIVAQVIPEDLEVYRDAGWGAGIAFQRAMEEKAYSLTGSLRAPAQRLTDFLDGKISESLPESSYSPGCVSADLGEILPKGIADALRAAFREFEKKKRGFITPEALLLAPETRTSAPVRVPRDPETLSSPDISGLFPCGEGSGYSGGIMSSALDGNRAAEAAAARLSEE